MVVGKLSGQEREDDDMNERLGGSVEAEGEGMEGKFSCGLSKSKTHLGFLGGR